MNESKIKPERIWIFGRVRESALNTRNLFQSIVLRALSFTLFRVPGGDVDYDAIYPVRSQRIQGYPRK